MKKMNLKRGLAALFALCMGIGLTACGGTETAGEDVKYYRANYQEELPDTFKNLNGSPVISSDAVYYAAYNDDYTKYGGAVLLGIRKPVVKIHGNAKSNNYETAILQADNILKQDLVKRLAQKIVKD